MVFQIRVTPKNTEYDKLFEDIQNGHGLYDNCTMEHSTPPVVVVEGHIKEEVEALLKELKKEFPSETFTLKDCPDEDTILYNRREETGFLMVRTAGYYEDLLKKILSVKEVLPALMSLDNYLDTRIAEALK